MISVVIPTLNEKKNISKIIKKLKKINIIQEIIFIDDSSTDGTYKEICRFKKYKFVRGYSRNNKMRDLSKSVLYGVRKTKKNYVLVMDCDLQHNPSYIKSMWSKIINTNCDIVIATRFTEKMVDGNLGYIRSFLSNFAISLINVIIGKKSSDPLSGFFLCKKEVFIKYEKKFFLRGYKILFDIIYNGKKNIDIRHQKIIFKKRIFEKSKFNFSIIWLFFLQILYTLFLVKK